jgi:hypothetical protein
MYYSGSGGIMANKKYMVWAKGGARIYEENNERKVIVSSTIVEEKTAVAGPGGTTPKGPLGHVFHGVFRGPIS